MIKNSSVWIACTVVTLVTVGVDRYLQSVKVSLLQQEVVALRNQGDGRGPQVHAKAGGSTLPVTIALPPETQSAARAAPAGSVAPTDPSRERELDPQTRWEEEARAGQAAVEAAFITQTTDLNWAATIVNSLRDSLRGLLPSAAAITAIECRTSMCRVELLHDDLQAARAFSDAAFSHSSTRIWPGSTMALEPEKVAQGLRVVMYLARPGTELIDRRTFD